jgi:hypothetical protein
MSYLIQNGIKTQGSISPTTSSGNSWGYGGVRTLSSGQTLPGEPELSSHSHVFVSATVEGGAATLQVQFSIDGGENWDTTITEHLTSGVSDAHVYFKGSRTCRVNVIAGDDDLTAVRVHTEYCTATQLTSGLASAIQLDADAAIVRPTISQDEIRIGRRTGVAGWTKLSYRTGLSSSAGEQVIWPNSGDTFTPMTTADTFTIAYTQANDGSSANGAKTLYIWYVDADGLPAQANHTLGNDGSDVTAFTGLGINRVAVSSSGSSQTNTAAITFTATGAATVQAEIPANSGVTQTAIFHCGSNHDAIVKYIRIDAIRASGGSTGTVLIKGYVYNRAIATRFEILRTTLDVAIELAKEFHDEIGFNLSPTDVLYFVADTDTNNFDIQCRFGLNEYQRN